MDGRVTWSNAPVLRPRTAGGRWRPPARRTPTLTTDDPPPHPTPTRPCAAVRDGLWVAALLFLVRLAGVWVGCWLGAGAGGTPPGTAKRLWMGMVTQVGGWLQSAGW